jgi:hypothetical protein
MQQLFQSLIEGNHRQLDHYAIDLLDGLSNEGTRTELSLDVRLLTTAVMCRQGFGDRPGIRDGLPLSMRQTGMTLLIQFAQKIQGLPRWKCLQDWSLLFAGVATMDSWSTVHD